MIVGIVSLLASSVSAVLSVPACVFAGEVFSSFLPRGEGSEQEFDDTGFTLAVLMPAHNEAQGIEATLKPLVSELGAQDRLVVVADNCSDDTAERARAAGATVIERTDAERRGKGYALTFGEEYLSSAPPDVVIIMDADCRIERGSLRQLAAQARKSGRPVQAIYLMDPPPERSAFASVSAFAFLVRNWVRPLGLKRLGLPCQLTGTGMAFPWQVFHKAPETTDFLVEDLLLGHELAIAGTPPLLSEEVVVKGELPSRDDSALKQRRRWEHGELSVLLQTAPRLLGSAVERADLSILSLAFDAAVPPLALLIVMSGAWAFCGLVLLAVLGIAWPLLISVASGTLLSAAVVAAYFRYGTVLLPPEDLKKIPRYILWKLPLYGSFFRKGAHSEWERTDRSG